MRDDWAVELYAAVAKTAVKDYQTGDKHRQGIMDAGKWLRLAGLLGDDGTFDMRYRPKEQVMATPESIEKRRAAAVVRIATSAESLGQRFGVATAEILSVPRKRDQEARALRDVLQLEMIATAYEQITSAATAVEA
jgi:hypothetical protein